MDIIVINLASQPRRWEAMQRECDGVGLQVTRHDAVVGSEPVHPGHRYCERLNLRHYHRPLAPGELGCYASHIAVWKRLLASDSRMIAVFEDDVEFAPRLPGVLDAIASSPADWDLVKLIGRASEKVESADPLCAGHSRVIYRRVPSLTGAYVLSRLGAEKLLARRTRFGRPVDVDLRHWWECELRVFGVLPYPVRQAPGSAESCIMGRTSPHDASSRVRKLAQQAYYTMGNALALRALKRDEPLPARPIQPATGRP